MPREQLIDHTVLEEDLTSDTSDYKEFSLTTGESASAKCSCTSGGSGGCRGCRGSDRDMFILDLSTPVDGNILVEDMVNG